MSVFVYAYNMASKSAKDLSRGLNTKLMKHEGSTVKDGSGLHIVNWGASDFPSSKFKKARIYNKPKAVATAVDKLKTFQALEKEKINIPAYTTDRATALGWIRDGEQVCARTTKTGSASAGLSIHISTKDLPQRAVLFTKYIPKKSEYRVHIVNGKAIIVQKKVFPVGKDSSDIDWRIRDEAQGFLFQGVLTANVDRKITKIAIDAVEALGLDFGGVDVIYNETHDTAYVLEVNTAPGLSESDVTSYSKALTTLIGKAA